MSTNVKNGIITLVTVFVFAALTSALAFNLNISSNWKAILIAGLTPVLSVISNWINPQYSGYGIGAA